MKFNERLQELRKQKGLTQEELAKELYVSRAAISKWESDRGYPGIESLKAIAKFFSVTVDDLLSCDEVLAIAEEDSREKETHLRDTVFGVLDCSVVLLLFLPIFGQRASGVVQEVSLLALTEITPYLRGLYVIAVTGMILSGILTLALQNRALQFWMKNKYKLSFSLNAVGALLFIMSLQPYAAAFLFIFLLVKMLLLVRR